MYRTRKQKLKQFIQDVFTVAVLLAAGFTIMAAFSLAEIMILGQI